MSGLSAFGLSYVLDNNYLSSLHTTRSGCIGLQGIRDWPNSLDQVLRRETEAVSRLQSWCKGLVGIVTTQSRWDWEALSSGMKATAFTHRSISDFLANNLQSFGQQWQMDDDTIGEAILVTYLAECKVRHAEHADIDMWERRRFYYIHVVGCVLPTSSTTVSPIPPAPRILSVLDEIEATDGFAVTAGKTSDKPALILGSIMISLTNWFVSLDIRIGTECPIVFQALETDEPPWNFILWSLINKSILLRYPASRVIMLTFITQKMRRAPLIWGEDTRSLIDLSPVLQTIFATGMSPNVRYPRLPTKKETQKTFSVAAWQRHLLNEDTSRQMLNNTAADVCNRSLWRECLYSYIALIVSLGEDPSLEPIWNQLQVWLEFGAEVPVEVLVVAPLFTNGPGGTNLRADYIGELKPIKMYTYHYAVHLGVGARFQGEKPQLLTYPYIAENIFPNRNGGWQLNKAAGTEYFQTFRSTTLSSIIRWHRPRNMDVLLSYTDPFSSIAENPQEWQPPSYDGLQTPTKEEIIDRTILARGDTGWIGHEGWHFDLEWRPDLHQWVPENFEELPQFKDSLPVYRGVTL